MVPGPMPANSSKLPAAHSAASSPAPQTPPSEEETHEAFAGLRDERTFEDRKRAKIVMGEPLGGSEAVEEVEKDNDGMLDELPSDTTDLELTHLRLKSLKGLRLERFSGAQRIWLRQNFLSSLSCSASTSLASTPGQTLGDMSKAGSEEPVAVPEISVPPPGEDGEPTWPLRNLTQLKELDLYDNRLKSVEGLENLPALTSLDLSFNLFRSVAELDSPSPSSEYAYPKLTHLYLIQNKLSRIEGVAHRTSLVYLELGGNRLRTMENLPQSANLRSLFLGKNKITRIENLEGMSGLKTLSIQSNRLTKIEGLENLFALEELYLSHNGLTKIEGLSANRNLTTLDVGSNKIELVTSEDISHLSLLEEFWANNNQIGSLPSLPPSSHPNLETVYLEGNPVQKTLGTTYRRKIMLDMPQVKQIDATFVKQV